MKRVYILFGGIWSFDGVATSAGMNILAGKLRGLPDTAVKTYLWSDFRRCFNDQNREVQVKDKMILIGYSGGAPYSTIIANLMVPHKEIIDLMVLYDPSPQQWMQRIHANVKRAFVYQNKSPTWFIYPLGGAHLESAPDGPKVEVQMIDMNHVAVQYDTALHDKTVEMVRAL